MYFTAPKDSSNCVYRTCWKNTAQCHDNGQRKPRAPGSREKRFLWRMFSIMSKILEKLTKNTSIPSNVYLLNFQVVIHFVIMMIELHESSFSFHVIFLIHKESGLDTPQCGSKKKKAEWWFYSCYSCTKSILLIDISRDSELRSSAYLHTQRTECSPLMSLCSWD